VRKTAYYEAVFLLVKDSENEEPVERAAGELNLNGLFGGLAALHACLEEIGLYTPVLGTPPVTEVIVDGKHIEGCVIRRYESCRIDGEAIDLLIYILHSSHLS